MAHPQQRQFFERLQAQHPAIFDQVEVIEIGSLDINGSVRDFFGRSTRYVGVDLAAGPGVDLIGNGAEIDLPDNSFDVAVSAECFEHNPEWIATFANMIRMSRSYVVMTCASDGRPEHGTNRSNPGASPFTLEWEYYRNLNQADFEQAFDLNALFLEHSFEYNPQSHDLYFWGIKRRSLEDTATT